MSASRNGIKKADEFYKQAVIEFNRARQKKSDVLFRDAAEKGWNAVVLATNYLIEKGLDKKPRNNRERRDKLFEIQNKNGKIKKYKFYERFGARAFYLHMQCFYDGNYTEEQLLENIKKVKSYLHDVQKAAGHKS